MKNIQEHVTISRNHLKLGNYEAEQIQLVETDKHSNSNELHKAFAELLLVIIESLKKNKGE